jgi:hypothetical protein
MIGFDSDSPVGAAAVVAGLVGVLAVGYAVASATGTTGSITTALGGLWAGVMVAVDALLGRTGTRQLLVGGGVVAFLIAIWRASEADSGDESTLWPLMALVSIGAVGYVVAVHTAWFLGFLRSLWWVPIVVVVGYIGYVFVDERTSAGSSSSATTQTNRRVGDTTEELANAGLGMFVAILGTASAVAITVIGSVEIVGDLLAPFAGEVAYLGTVALGYLGLGGSLPYGWIVPDLGPAQFVAIAMIIGGLAIAFRR